jgi:hypothetical protein
MRTAHRILHREPEEKRPLGSAGVGAEVLKTVSNKV